ncbi:MAG TPA: enoyl-CoA hydratase/isomerase family protein [Chloroflexota bacterium]|jgi:enoyl-CoA hydratase/carnithine racemase
MAGEWTVIRDGKTAILERLGDTGVARITLNRPERRNALNPEMVDEVVAALEQVRADTALRAVITRGAGPSYCSGLDLYFLRAYSAEAPGDWDRPSPTVRLFHVIREFPRIMIAQVHGYCLGGGLALMNSHDLVIAATSAQIGMPEILRGSFGQIATSTLFHAGIPLKKAALIQLGGRNLSGAEADRLGLVSMAVEEAELEDTVNGLATEIASRHPATLAHAKIAVQMGRDLTLEQAMQVDALVGARQRLAVDPLAHVEDYLHSQKSRANASYRRPDA